MKPEEIHLTDWARIFAGQVPPSFYVELVIRALFIYMLLMFSMRFLGKRMSNQMTLLELTAMVSLAAAIGVPMLAFDRGLLPTVIITAVVLPIVKLVAKMSYGNQKFEEVTQGDLDILVDDGVMCYDTMRKARISRERLFAQLRSENLNHLGKVKRLYMEANGVFTIIPEEKEQAGLLVLPEWDKEFIENKVEKSRVIVCNNCGADSRYKAADKSNKCNNCGDNDWTNAVIEKQ